jgi:hypothetical protein
MILKFLRITTEDHCNQNVLSKGRGVKSTQGSGIIGMKIIEEE